MDQNDDDDDDKDDDDENYNDDVHDLEQRIYAFGYFTVTSQKGSR